MATKAKKSLDCAAIVRRLTSGDSTLFEESERAGLTPNTPLRNALTKHCGGKKQYTAMIAKAMKARVEKEERKSPARKAA
jgi:lambda repressor-like predicted transcriptional regulator